MVSDAALAQLVADSYTQPMDIVAGDDARCKFVTIGNEFVVVVPGTSTLPGWIRDFEWWPEKDHQIGRCHTGFLTNGRNLWNAAASQIKRATYAGASLVFAAHSLGGAEAQIMAAFYVSLGLPEPRVVCFGSPRVALCTNIRLWLMMHPVSMTLYARAGDPVPDVPFAPLYLHLVTPTKLGVALPGSDSRFPLDPVNDPNHGIAQYAADLKAMEVCE
jgi:Lipase (class 3)